MKKGQIENIISYLKQQEKNQDGFKIGAEFEYFVVDENTLESISYYGEKGIENSLKLLLLKNYQGIYEDEHLIGLKIRNSTITLEPGSQIEISVEPYDDISKLEEEYKFICQDLIEVFGKKGQILIACGYRIKDKIADIKIIPKKRYSYMYEYFKIRGKYAHNMMKQTASTQVTIDYQNEEDFSHKLRILNTLTPVFYAFFDNAPYFEGNIYPNYSLRSNIWDNCDDDRCGIIKDTISNHFTYADYAKYILRQAIIFNNDGYTSDTLFTALYTNQISELEHALSMVFPDVRIRKYIEIRMFDSLPYPLNFAVIALIKGLFYDETNLRELYHFCTSFTLTDVLKAKKDIKILGIKAKLKNLTVKEIMIYLLELAYKGLEAKELTYLLPLKRLIDSGKTPKEMTLNDINWCKIRKLK